jgi:hypothetical protein
LGAYTEYVKLLSARGRAHDRRASFTELAGSRLVGGGFAPFKELADQIDALIATGDPAGAASARDVARFFVSESVKYATTTVKLRKQLHFCRPGRGPHMRAPRD